jgi:calcium-dependent protein kinase
LDEKVTRKTLINLRNFSVSTEIRKISKHEFNFDCFCI